MRQMLLFSLVTSNRITLLPILTITIRISAIMRLVLSTFLFLMHCYAVQTFAPLSSRTRASFSHVADSRPMTRLQYKDDRYITNEVLPIPNDFKLFLTQCSIQSFMFLLKSMRDPETLMWIEEFTQPAIVQKRDAILGVAILEDSRVVDEEEVNNGNKDSKNVIGDNKEESIVSALEASPTNDNDEPTERELTEISVLSFSLLFRTLHVPESVKSCKSSDEGKEAANADPNDEECDTDTQQPQKFSKLLEYHGLAALNTTIFPTWDSYFEQLLERPTEYFIVEAASPHVPDYELDIDPSSICSRIVSVRDQISKEFVNDLQVIAEMGNKTLASYWENLKKREKGNDEQPLKLERENLMFLELSPKTSNSHGPSPLRKGNFDLLTLLTTQESIHRVLADESRQSGPEVVTNEYLKQFYLDRVHWFRGPQHYGRADDFLEELLSRSPRMINVADGVTSLIDPTRIAELVLEARKQVALEWKELAAQAPMEHMEIQKMRLNRIMGVTKKKESEEPFQ